MDFSLLNAVSNLERRDGVIAVPGGVCYALACRPDYPDALARMHRIKGLAEPLLLLGWDLDALTPYVENIPGKARTLIERHWPGPLILMLPKSGLPCDTITPHTKIKLMRPEEPLIRDLLSLMPHGVLATACAGRRQDQPAQTAMDVLNTFGDDIDYILVDDYAVREAVAPTVASIEADGTVRVLRSGRIVLD
jgi:L-threonylcarbamoyladenylate synthase